MAELLTWINRKSPEAQEETRVETRTTEEYEKLHLEIK